MIGTGANAPEDSVPGRNGDADACKGGRAMRKMQKRRMRNPSFSFSLKKVTFHTDKVT